MAQSCELCHRKPLNSATRSHSNIKTKKRQKINLQGTRYQGRKIRACTSCITSLYR